MLHLQVGPHSRYSSTEKIKAASDMHNIAVTFEPTCI